MPPIGPDESSTPPLARWLLARVEANGTPEELALVDACRPELQHFLNHPDTQRIARKGALEVGLENRQVLKLNLMAGVRYSPWGLIDNLADHIPRFREIAEYVLRYRIKCHVGLKLTPKGVEYELYPCEVDGKPPAAALFERQVPGRAPLPAPIHCFGYSSSGSLSAYAEVKNVDKAELEALLGFTLPSAGLRINALFNSRLLPDGDWHTEKAGIEFTPFPSHLINTVLEHFELRFACLLHRGGSRKYGIVGVHGGRKVLYTRLFPLRPGHAPDN